MHPPGRLRTLASAIVVTAAALLAIPVSAATASAAAVHPAVHPTKRGCAATVKAGFATCFSIQRTDVAGHKGLFAASAAPSGYGPSQLDSAYNLPSASAGAGETVAVVDAYDDPTAEADLQVYRAQYGLPVCDSANGCFTKVAQDGSTNYPSPDPDWSTEISLDLDMVSAICPNCHILLVEADDASIANLGTAVNEAVTLGAKFVSNSYGGPEDPSELTDDSSYYDHPGVVVTASSGDNAYGVEYPAASPYVTAVGGTSLAQDSSVSRGWAESAWSGAGSGCSTYEAKPSWQADSGCANRTVADVSAVADPNTGVAAYDSYSGGGWGVWGGTSVASPIIASTYALAGTPVTGTYPSSYPYADTTALNDVTSGSNGTCDPLYLCTAGTGYDGPTGLGTPNGVAAFSGGPHGTVSGTVTDAGTGKPVADAEVDVGSQPVYTSSAGTYSATVPAGSYPVTVKDFGYQSQTDSGVQVTDGQTSTENFALQAVPSVTLTGTVTDGSGQGWPLYAKVSVPGTPASAYTSPSTGKYTLTLPDNGTYNVTVDPVYPGYQQAQQSVQAGTSDLTQNFSVPVDASSCSALGYQFNYNGTCAPTSGGLVEGVVKDGNTGAGVDGATVTSVSAPSDTATTAPTTGDPSIGDGFYYMFVPGTGSQQLTAAKTNYTTATGTATVTAGAVTPLTITMQAGQLSITPGSVSSSIGMGGSATQNLTFKDTGQAPVNVKLYKQPSGFTMLGQPSGATGAPLQRVKGTFSPLSAAKAGKPAGGASKPAAQPDDAPWTTVANYPTSIMDNAVATDPATGLVYSVGGNDGSNVTTAGYVYDPGTEQWTALPPMRNAREAPQAAFINGKLYVTGGWGTDGDPVATTEIYDPGSGTWSTGANMPSAYAGASVAVLNGEMYVIGGCDAVNCGHNDVQVYDPATNSWSAAASYPTSISWEGCGAVNGEIYCAGGTTNATTDTSDAYVYDPGTDSWSPIAPIPIDLWGMGYTAANGELLLSGGVTNGFSTVTNQGYAYDPSSGSWTALPNANNADYRGGSGCGLYRIGGTTVGSAPQNSAEQLPGYTSCGTTATVPWMSESQTQLTLNPGQQTTVTVTLNAGDASVTQPGAYTAGLQVSDDTPYQTSPVNVTMNVTPPKSWGKITGTVSGLACAGTTGPLQGATVQIDGAAANYTLKTDSNGKYQYWIDKSDNPLTVTASLNGWQPKTIKEKVSAGAAISANFTLSPDAC